MNKFQRFLVLAGCVLLACAMMAVTAHAWDVSGSVNATTTNTETIDLSDYVGSGEFGHYQMTMWCDEGGTGSGDLNATVELQQYYSGTWGTGHGWELIKVLFTDGTTTATSIAVGNSSQPITFRLGALGEQLSAYQLRITPTSGSDITGDDELYYTITGWD